MIAPRHSSVFTENGVVEKTYLKWDGEPLLFLFCSDNGECYLATVVDIVDENSSTSTLYVRVSADDIRLIEQGTTSLRDAFSHAASGTVTLVRRREGSSDVSVLDCSSLDDAWLCDPDARLAIVNE